MTLVRNSLLVFLFLLGGTGVGQAEPAPAQTVFWVDAEASEIEFLLGREGLFSGFAHDHVLVARNLSGQIAYDPRNPANSIGQVRFPVASLEVDAPARRAARGLAGEVSPADLASIRTNMLAPPQLDGAAFPMVEVETLALEGIPPAMTARVAVTLKGVRREMSIGLTLLLREDVLTLSGQTVISQRALGIEPYSFFLGTVRVKDRVAVRFHLVARAKP